MNLKCKIYPKYLDEIIKGKKKYEYREIESIEFDDGNRKIMVDVISVWGLSKFSAESTRGRYPDVPWQNKPMIGIELGKKIEEELVK